MANYIAVDNNFNETKRRNFFIFEIITAFTWMFFHFTVVFFFMIKLQSVMLVGLFLGFGNFISFLSDSPIGVLQRYFKPKSLFLTGAYLMMMVGGVFLYFTFATSQIELGDISIFSTEAIKWLFSSVFNIGLLLFSAISYGVIKELGEVTANSYIMNNTDPSQYSELFSKKSIFAGIGNGTGLILSGVILAFHPFIAILIFIFIVLFYIFFIKRYFDNGFNEVGDDIKKIKLLTKDNIIKGLNDYKTQIVDNKTDLREKTENLKVIFLKPLELKEKIDFKEIINGTKNDLISFFKIMFQAPYNYRLLVIGGIFVIFGFWDNFVTTFLIDYIDEILASSKEELVRFYVQDLMTAYVVIGIICIPAFGAQIPLVAMAQKYGIWKVMIPGLLISAISMFVFGFAGGIGILLFAGLMNGIGYASSLPLSQGEFSAEYNITYSEKNNLKQIDASASSAPIKMLSNLANVLGLVVGGVLIQIFGYTITFIVLGLILLFLFLCTTLWHKKLKLW